MNGGNGAPPTGTRTLNAAGVVIHQPVTEQTFAYVGSWSVMSGITLAMAACLAGQRDWRRVTIGNDGSGRFGFAGRQLPVYGSINVPGYGGQTILTANASQTRRNQL
jgi:hypothetical protein